MIKSRLTSSVALMMFFVLVSSSVNAKVWRVNNNAGVNADFSQLSTAVLSASVLAGDTIYTEGSATNYQGVTLNKRLVIIGSGYFLSGNDANPGLQANPFPANFPLIYIDSLASGSVFMGMSFYCQMNRRTDNISFIRTTVYIEDFETATDAVAQNIIFNKCLMGGYFNSRMIDLQMTNCIGAYNFLSFPNVTNGFIRNNTFGVQLSISNSYVANNVFLNGIIATNCVVKYNFSTTNNLPAGQNNQVNVPQTQLIVGSGSSDGRYQLAAGSPAIAAGEPVNGVTPDAGAFGTADPYRLSGIPPIPTIYSLTVPTSIPATATSLNITFSTRSNN